MGTPTLIGVPALRGGYTARYLHHGDHPAVLIPLLRRIWTDTFDRDTTAMTTAVLARDWSGLTTTGRPGRHRPPPISGLGHPAPTSTAEPRHGVLGEEVDGYLEWLYLLHTDQPIVVVYEATCHARWLRHSLHHLDPAGDLFVTEPDPTDRHGPPLMVCTVCGAADEIDYLELPSMTGAGSDTSTACRRCGSAATTDPMFGAHVTRRPWPPSTPPPDPGSSQPQ